jgi:hypothetical protein
VLREGERGGGAGPEAGIPGVFLTASTLCAFFPFLLARRCHVAVLTNVVVPWDGGEAERGRRLGWGLFAAAAAPAAPAAAAADGTWPRSCMRPTDEAYVSRRWAVWDLTQPGGFSGVSLLSMACERERGVVFGWVEGGCSGVRCVMPTREGLGTKARDADRRGGEAPDLIPLPGMKVDVDLKFARSF